MVSLCSRVKLARFPKILGYWLCGVLSTFRAPERPTENKSEQRHTLVAEVWDNDKICFLFEYSHIHVRVCGGEGRRTHPHIHRTWGRSGSVFPEGEEKGGGLSCRSLWRAAIEKLVRSQKLLVEQLWTHFWFFLTVFWRLFRTSRELVESHKESEVACKKCLILESIRTWRELFLILKVCFLKFVLFCLSFTYNVYVVGLWQAVIYICSK